MEDMELFLISENISLEFSENQFWVIREEERTPVNLVNIERIWVHPEIHFPGRVLEVLLKARVELAIRNEEGSMLGMLCPWDNPHGTKARQAQVLFALSGDAQSWMAHWLFIKHQRQITWIKQFPELLADAANWPQLQHLHEEQKLALSAPEVVPADMKEAYFSRLYLQMVNVVLPPEYRFPRRSRQPAEDFYNALINYAYGMLYGICEGALRRARLDPYIGFLHKEKEGNPVLVYDFIEAYRPWADQVCVLLCRDRKIGPKDFRPVDKGLWLGGSGKTILIRAMMDFLDQTPEGTGKNNFTRKERIFRDAKELQLLIAAWDPSIV